MTLTSSKAVAFVGTRDRAKATAFYGARPAAARRSRGSSIPMATI